MKIKVFILAAGRGERLRPITEKIPKPLLPVCGMPVIERVLNRIQDLSPEGIGVNLHYMASEIRQWLADYDKNKNIHLFFEDPILGTGGAIKNAESFLRHSHFIVHNADIVSDINLKDAIDFHLSKNNIATLIIHDYPEFNNLVIDGHRLHGLKKDVFSGKPMAFTGIAIYAPEFLKLLPSGYSSIVDAWLKAIDEGYSIGVFDVTGSFWSDIGSIISYARTVFSILNMEGELIYVHPSVQTDNIELNGYVSIEAQAEIKNGSFLRNVIVLGGTVEETIENMIIGDGFRIPLEEMKLFQPSSTFTLSTKDGILIGTGGSDRAYYRIGNGFILMKCRDDDPDFLRHIEYSRYLIAKGIRVARLISYDDGKKTAVFEDLGDITLYSWLKGKKDISLIEEMYRRVIDLLVHIHSIEPPDSLSLRIFDYNHFRWESRYFVERFLRPFAGLDTTDELERFFDNLARRADSYPKRLVHRDFQSQNIMIKKGNPYVIDFQGMRLGPPGYDVVSILWDCYYRLEDSMQKRLLEYYITRAKDLIPDFDDTLLLDSIAVMRIQRHMQALGAFGFLSIVKKKRYFLKYIHSALMFLKEDINLFKNHLQLFQQLLQIQPLQHLS